MSESLTTSQNQVHNRILERQNSFNGFKNPKPFLKWAGGKTQLIPEIEKRLPQEILTEKFTYVEPFVGSGAVLFWMLNHFPNLDNAVINDVNADLINVYRQIKTAPQKLIETLKDLQIEFHALNEDEEKKKAYYYEKRDCYNTRQAENSIQVALFWNRNMKQHEAVIQTLEKLGGIATLGQLNQEVFKIKDCEWKTKTPFASIRRIVQLNKEIYKIKPGLYGLKTYQNQNEAKGIFEETEKNKNSNEVKEFNHSYYQGLIITVGNLKNFQTFLPHQDKNKMFLNEKLGSLTTLDAMPEFSYKHFVQRSSTIDAIWFNERKMPHSFFEVEHSTDIQNSLLKFNDLQDFNSRMFIVADKVRRKEFEMKMQFAGLRDIKDRVKFLDYDTLSKQYEQTVESTQFAVII